jgi:Ca2+-transporting ATPase
MQRLLGTTALSPRQWGMALLSAVVLLVLWEGGKWIARRRSSAAGPLAPAADAVAGATQ